MVCEKCGGHLVPEGDIYQGEKWFGERCSACSRPYEAVINKNREESLKRMRKHKREAGVEA